MYRPSSPGRRTEMTSRRVPGNWALWNMKTGPHPGSGLAMPRVVHRAGTALGTQPPRCQHVIDHQGDVRVALRIVKFPAPSEVAAADVDDVQFGVVAPAQGNDVRHTG